jgi:hypothetical protein
MRLMNLRAGLVIVIMMVIGLSVSPGYASWKIDLRPLEKKPYGRNISPLFKIRVEVLSHLEGAGIELKRGRQDVFSVPLAKDGKPRQLEFQLGYLTNNNSYERGKSCRVEYVLTSSAGISAHKTVDIPLRSIHPAAETVETLQSGYDYLLPSFRHEVSPRGTSLKLTLAMDKQCDAGRVVLYDPKIWVKKDDTPAKRFFMIVADSISADWFDSGRSFMPATVQFFKTEGGIFATDVYSVSTNTDDTTSIIAKMKFLISNRHSPKTIVENGRGLVFDHPLDNVSGLVPTFLNAGYDAIAYNSNLLLSTVFEGGAGFRNFYNLNVDGPQANARNPEIMTAMAADWVKRHPEHDALFLLWFDATHVNGPHPRYRDNLDLKQVPYAGPERAMGAIQGQAQSISYVDLVLENFLKADFVQDSDFIFFADHGINFDTLEHGTPLWGVCQKNERPANWHLMPVEVHIPAGLKINGATLKPPTAETSIIDWIYTAVKKHNPRLDLSNWEGADLATADKHRPILMASHGQRGAMRLEGRHILFSDQTCNPLKGGFFLNLDYSRAKLSDIKILLQELNKRSLLSYFPLRLDFLHGLSSCQVEVKWPVAFGESGSVLDSISIDLAPDRWYSNRILYIPEILGSVAGGSVSATPAGCVEVKAGYIQRKVDRVVDLTTFGLAPFYYPSSEIRLPDHEKGQVNMSLLNRRFVRRGGSMLDYATGDAAKVGLSAELKAAMKSWGYIHDKE